jgi:PAS domain S-box-containing protein
MPTMIKGEVRPVSRVLVVDDEPGVKFTLSEFLKHDGHEVHTAANAAEALSVLERRPLDIVISDIILPKMSGIDLLHRIRQGFPTVETILITGEPTVASATEAMRAGAVDYLAKPVSGNTIQKAVVAAVGVKALKDENRKLQEEIRRHRDHLQDLVEARTQQVVEYSRRLHRIAERTKVFATITDIQRLVKKILTLLADDTGAEGGSVYLRDQDHLVLVHALDPAHQAELIPLPQPDGRIVGRVIDRAEPLLVRNLDRDGSLQGSGWSGYRDSSLLALPLVDAIGVVEGITFLHNKRLPPFTDQDIELGRIISGHGMAALTSARLTHSLAESEHRHRALVENAPVGIMSIDASGNILDLNPALLKMLASPSADATRMINVLNFPPIVEAGITAVFLKCLNTGHRLIFEGNYKSKWGKATRFKMTVAPIRNHGEQVVGVEAIVDQINDTECDDQ